MIGSFPNYLKDRRTWGTLVVLVVAIWLQFPVESAVYRPLVKMAALKMMAGNEMQLPPYAALTVYRLFWGFLVVAAIRMVLGRPIESIPLLGPSGGRMARVGLVTGIAVMIAAICAIILTRNATVMASGQTFAADLANGSGWLVFEAVGAAGEELLGRVAILLVAERLVGWRGAILVSGILFSVGHIWNPGASPIWLARLFLQGVLLAYAVYRTRSFWWSVGYHTGWNWADAPLFGAAGSGYPVAGHIFSFTPIGSDWITGGTVGPEGSVFSFVAVLTATVLLCLTTADWGADDRLLATGSISEPWPQENRIKR